MAGSAVVVTETVVWAAADDVVVTVTLTVLMSVLGLK